MKMIAKTERIGTKDVPVDVEALVDEQAGVVRVIASLGGHRHEHTVTLGPADAPLPAVYDQAQAQADIDAAIRYAAVMAESKLRRQELLEGLQ